MSAEAKIKELGITLPEPKPLGNYVPGVLVGNLLFLSGHGPDARRCPHRARQGRPRPLVDEGYQVAREVGINLLGSARYVLGSLDRVKRVVKVLGMVNSAEGFGDQPKVINGFSDLMVEVFGDNGRHARSAVGMAELPVGIPVEIEMILEVDPKPRSSGVKAGKGRAGSRAARRAPADRGAESVPLGHPRAEQSGQDVEGRAIRGPYQDRSLPSIR